MRPVTSVRLPDDLKTKVDAISKRRGQSFSAFIVEAVDAFVRDEVMFDRMENSIRQGIVRALDDERKRTTGGV